MDVILSFDTEDFVTPEAQEAQLWWAQELSARGIRGCFQLVGEMVRRWQANDRRDIIDAIAQHEHIPEIVAVELGNYLIHCADGVPRIRRIILDDIEQAASSGDTRQVASLKLVLQHFIETHPEPSKALCDAASQERSKPVVK